MSVCQRPVIDFDCWASRRPRTPQPPRRRRHRSRPHRRRPGSAGVAIVATLAAIVIALAPPTEAQVLIQEVLYDGPGSDGDDAFTELVGPAGMTMEDWSLVGINGGKGTVYRTVDLSGAVIPSDCVLVIATSSANDSLAAVRDFIGSVDWQNGPDAVRLLDASGAVVDGLQYGDAGAFNAGEGTPAPTTSAGKSLSRDNSATDTNDNLADFTVTGIPTPGVGAAPEVEPPDAEPPDAEPPSTDPLHTQPPSTQIKVSIPDTTAFGGDTLVVPVRFTNTSGHGLLASEVFLTYDAGLLTPIHVLPGDLLDNKNWHLAANPIESSNSDSPIDTLRIALATDVDTLSGAGALVLAHFQVADLRRPAATDLRIEHLSLNGGAIIPEREDGVVRLVGIDAVTATVPSPVLMHDTLHVTVTDHDIDRRSTQHDTLVIHLTEGPEDAPPEQIETLFAVETDTTSGIFTSSIAILYSDAVSANGVVETAPRRVIELCFDDSLDGAGATTRRCTLLAIPAHDGLLDATVVTEPGDTLWIRLVDLDLNRHPDTIDTATVSIITHDSADTQRTSLVEIDLSNGIFFGHFETSPVTGGNALQTTYLDLTPSVGDPSLVTDTTHVLGQFGDADDDGQLQAFDASRILTHVLAPGLSARDSLAANVDSLAPFGAISPFDAALVLQHRVGLRRRFPVQESFAANHPRPEPGARDGPDSTAARAAGAARRVELRDEVDYLSIWIDDRSQIIAGDLLLEWEEIRVETVLERADDMHGFLLASRLASPDDEGRLALRVVIAGVSAAIGPGELFRLYPRRDGGRLGPGAVRLIRASFNDGRIPVRLAVTAAREPPRPNTFSLHANHPNPFNAGTVIAFELATPSHTYLDVIGLLGQRVRRLITEQRRAGRHHVLWDGLDDTGQPAATGVYLVRLRAGRQEETRRMLLLR